MKSACRAVTFATLIGAVLLCNPLAGHADDGPMDSAIPTSQPTPTYTGPRDVRTILADTQVVTNQLSMVLNSKAMSDAAARNDLAPRAIPVLYHHLQLLDELAATKKYPVAPILQARQSDQTTLYLLNDAPTVKKVKEMMTSSQPARQIDGQSIDLQSRWIANSADANAATQLLDEVEKLDRAHPDSIRLTMLTMSMQSAAHDEQQADRLDSLVLDVKTDAIARQRQELVAQQKASEARVKAANEGTPIVITGKTVDGKDFTTADWKGKVVLVDFWAVWCGPCVAEMPHLKETYAKYHDQGFEILGVNNDPKADTVTDFTDKEQLPWPQLFAPSEDPGNRFSPNTSRFGIEGIPTMFLIDKKGICRSTSGRADMDALIPKLLAE